MRLEPRWAIFLSGRGTTAQAAMDCLDEANIRLVVSSKKDVMGLARARRMGIPTVTFSGKIDWATLSEELARRQISRIFLLGYMRILPEEFLQNWSGKIWNLHPSLLPDFKGGNAIEESYEAGGSMGVSIHDVVVEMDAGRVRYQTQSVNQSDRSENLNLELAQLRISRDEQRMVRSALLHRSHGKLELT